ncbi:hypothetical protein L484_009694 [Morus notabilis]|uniref:Uncharacterized protein n=1 Tax=Morus notabilis TaxID=981085 RepID=W9SDU0_9ROSA|nr:hypothetical protein L484_009694 [Morus notabilis]
MAPAKRTDEKVEGLREEIQHDMEAFKGELHETFREDLHKISKLEGSMELMIGKLEELLRQREGSTPRPSAPVMELPSVPTTAMGGVSEKSGGPFDDGGWSETTNREGVNRIEW